MGWADALALALRELRRRPGRATLTIVAIALAASLLTALVAIAGTAGNRVVAEITHGGPLASINVVAAAPNPGQAGLDNPTPGPPRNLTAGALAAIRAIPGVVSVTPLVQAFVIVIPPARPPPGSRLCRSAQGQSTQGRSAERRSRCRPTGPAGTGAVTVLPFGENIVGVNLSHVGSLPVSLLAGAYPAPNSTTEVDVTGGYVSRLGLPQSARTKVIGTQVEIGAFRRVDPDGQIGLLWRTVTVVGVVEQQAVDGEFLAYPGLAIAAFNWTLAGRADGDIDESSSLYAGALVQADQLDRVNGVRDRIAAIGYSSSAPQGVLSSIEKYLHVVEFIFTAIGAVALVVAALGVANALLSAVRERRREIGVMKAVGARDRDVMRTFLGEAAALGLVGGALGTLIGLGVFLAIGDVANRYLSSQGLSGVPVTVPWYLPVGTTAGAVLLAVAAGAVPARRAAHLSAREAAEA